MAEILQEFKNQLLEVNFQEDMQRDYLCKCWKLSKKYIKEGSFIGILKLQISLWAKIIRKWWFLTSAWLKSILNKDGKVSTPRSSADFRGTISFASLNAHKWQDLSRRDDLWSWYFVFLMFFNEPLKWRVEKDHTMSEVRRIKQECIDHPEEFLWSHETDDIPQIRQIFKHIKSKDLYF